MWAIAFPFILAAWVVLVAVLTSFIGRLAAGTDAGIDWSHWRPVRRGLRWVFYLSVGYGGLILVVAHPVWFYWGQLHVRGVPVSARVVSWSREYESEESRQFTLVSYEFEAEVDGQRRSFRREGELRGWHCQESGYVRVLHDPADPSDSRMTHEFGNTRNIHLSVASFLVLGVGSFLLSRRSSHAGADAVSAREKVPPNSVPATLPTSHA